MKRELITHYSKYLNREMHILIHGHTGVPFLAFPCQDGMCDNWEGFQMQETLSDFIESGQIQLFSVDTVDLESWSDTNGDPGHRAWIQECYYNYIIEEALPLIRQINGTENLPIATGFSLGATHAAIVFFRRPDLFGGVCAHSGCYDTQYFWGDFSNELVYNNNICQFLWNIPKDHPYIDLYNQRRIVICVGQGAWEDEGRRTTAIVRDALLSRGVDAWIDFWGYDVNHDWPWWRKQIRYFIPWIIAK